MDELPPELAQYIAYSTTAGLGAGDVLSLALANKRLHFLLLTGFGRDLHRALAPLRMCIASHWWRAARIRIRRDDASGVFFDSYDLQLVLRAPPASYAVPDRSADFVAVLATMLAQPTVLPLQAWGGFVALADAVEHGHARAVDILLAHPRIDPAASRSVVMKKAAFAGNVAILRALLDDGRADPCAGLSHAPMRIAAANGHAGIVELLLADGRADPSVAQGEALRMAARNGHAPVVELLLADPRVDVHAMTDAPLRLAAAHGHAAIVTTLLRAGADPTAMRSGALVGAVRAGHVDCVRALAAAGVDVGGTDGQAARVAATLPPGAAKDAIVELLATGGRCAGQRSVHPSQPPVSSPGSG